MRKHTIVILLLSVCIFLLASCKECEHEWSAWSVVTEATETIEGMEQRVCASCKEIQTRRIPLLSPVSDTENTTDTDMPVACTHDWSAWSVIMEATETADGVQQRACTSCGETQQQSLPMLSTVSDTEHTADTDMPVACTHNWSAWSVIIAATETAEGIEQRTCADCGEAQQRSIPVLTPVSDMENTTDTNVPETCTHDWSEWDVVSPATCSAEGMNERRCTMCGKTEAQNTPTVAHTMGTWAEKTKPTCSAEGVNERKCTMCGKAETQNTPTVAHTMGAWAEKTKPTCSVEGENERKCTMCGKAETQNTPTVAHSMGEWMEKTKPTCSVEGVNERKCTMCGKAETQNTPTVAHSMGEWVEKTKPTCNAEGVSERKCTICGKTETQNIPKAEHTPSNKTSCGDVPCRYCGTTLTLEHNYTKIAETSATLLSAGTVRYQCTRCRDVQVQNTGVLDPASLGMPIVYITETENTDLPVIDLEKADGEIFVEYKYVSNAGKGSDFEAYCKIKVQGSSSTQYPKKNYNVKFYKDASHTEKLKVDLGWGKENKYCMKANYMDASHARNIVGGRIFAQMVASRNTILSGLENAPNYGAVDGFPVLVYLNGSFHGLYTMNIPKDEWMFAMEGDETTKEAALIGDDWKDPVYLRSPIVGSYEANGYELEYCSTADDSWVRDSFNELIYLLNCGDFARIKRELPNHLDIEAGIDNMLFTYFIIASDNYAKHLYWITYDGKVWAPSVYDLDSTFGIIWDGSSYNSPFQPDLTKWNLGWASNKMYETLIRLYPEEVEARYRALRQSIFTTENVKRCFDGFMSQIPEIAYQSEWKRWPDIPYYNTNLTNMVPAIQRQIWALDAIFYNLS